MSQSLLENDLGGVDITLSPDSPLQEGSEHGSLYTIPLLLIMGLSLKDEEKNDCLCSGIALDEKYKEEITFLLLEPRPSFMESLDSTKQFGGRFGVLGFNSRGGRSSQRGRTFTGHLGGTGRRSIIRQPSENLWDMPCSEMNSLTLGDIREAESKMKAEDLTLDQYVERQKESSERKSMSLSQPTQKKNFVSIPISGETLPIKQQRPHQHQSDQDCPTDRLSRGAGASQSQPSTDILQAGEAQAATSASLRGELAGDETAASSLLPAGHANTASRKSSSISEVFLNGPANLSLFDVNTPIFDDDNNELAAATNFRMPTIGSGASTGTSAAGLEDGVRIARHMPGLSVRGQRSFDQMAGQSTASNFSWLGRGGHHEELDNKNMSNLSSNSQSFPALSKSSQFAHPQARLHSDSSSVSSEPNILQKLQAAGIAPKLVSKALIGNHLGHNDGYFDSKFKQHLNTTEYPPLSSASNMPSLSSISSPGYHSLKLNSQSKSNDAGRLLMSIIGAGQHNNRNFASGFNTHSNMGGAHNPHDSHGPRGNNGGYNNSGQVGHFARY